MRKYLILCFFIYFNDVLCFNWMSVKMMCWVRVHLRISLLLSLVFLEYFVPVSVFWLDSHNIPKDLRDP